jgi:hypothetical protein
MATLLLELVDVLLKIRSQLSTGHRRRVRPDLVLLSQPISTAHRARQTVSWSLWSSLSAVGSRFFQLLAFWLIQPGTGFLICSHTVLVGTNRS